MGSIIKITHTGNLKKTRKFLRNSSNLQYRQILNHYGQIGVTALSSATPKDSGETADSWRYNIIETKGSYKLEWYNTHMAGDVPVAVLLQYGHATRNGGYVYGEDFINPALKEVFDKLARDAWKEVTDA